MRNEDIIDRLFDLYKQATTERSHYYVADTVQAAMEEIARLRLALNEERMKNLSTLTRRPR